jgi:chromosome segregation ATPase
MSDCARCERLKESARSAWRQVEAMDKEAHALRSRLGALDMTNNDLERQVDGYKSRLSALAAAARAVRFLLTDQLQEVHNSTGGVIGYTVTLDEEQTREIMAVCDRAALEEVGSD